jgi:hypothetical protein
MIRLARPRGNQHVGWLYITVDQSGGMGGIEC